MYSELPQPDGELLLSCEQMSPLLAAPSPGLRPSKLFLNISIITIKAMAAACIDRRLKHSLLKGTSYK